ncbi:MAG: folate family ECF transporter S component [Ruminiclostridium sp.]|nr:folate family ECF transporter S component [Ruminiclostridium sp.]
MSFFEKFGRSAMELRSIKCITVTGVLIALDLVLKLISVKITADLKITFAYLCLAAIGMFFGPTVAFLAGAVTDILGFLLNPDGGFSPLFTLVEAVGAMIYGIFLYNIKPIGFEKKQTDTEKNKSLIKTVAVSLAVGVGAGLLTGAAMLGVSALMGLFAGDEGTIGKIAGIFVGAQFMYIGAVIGFIYGVFFTALIMSGTKEKNGSESSLKIILSKVTVVIVCNLFMTPMAMIISGYATLDSMIAGFPLRLVKNLIQCPVDCLIMIIILFPVLSAYNRIFPRNGHKSKVKEQVGGIAND